MKFIRLKTLTLVALMTTVALAYQNCGHNLEFDGSSLNNRALAVGEVLATDRHFEVVSATKYVCEPFGSGNTGSNAQGGLKASLRYLDQNAVPAAERNSYILSTHYFSEAHKNVIVTDRELYFSSVNTPARAFTNGFQQSDGSYLLNASAERLVEYFAIEYNSVLKLGAENKNGFYRLAALSDDGVIVETKTDGTWKTLIDGDGTHSVRMSCSDKAIYLDKDSKLPIRIRYFQGPRTRIANQLLWQYAGETENFSQEKNCQHTSNDFFFTVTETSSTPTADYKEMEKRGWQVVAPDNFKLPDNEVNPCQSNLDLQIGSFEIASASNGGLKFKFATSLPMKASIQVKDDAGNVVAASEDKSDTLEHEVALSGLDVTKTYSMSATIKSDSLGVMYQRKFDLVPIESPATTGN